MLNESLNVLDLAALLESDVVPEVAKEIASSLFVRFRANAINLINLTDTGVILDSEVDKCATCKREIPPGEGIRRMFEFADIVDISHVPGCRNDRYVFAHIKRAFCSSLCNNPGGSIEG